MTNYWVGRDGQRFGPYPEHVLREHVARGAVLMNDLVWTEGMTAWVSVDALLSGLSGGTILPGPPPQAAFDTPAAAAENAKAVPHAEASNTIVWWLAFAPLIGAVIAELLAGATQGDPAKFWWTTLGLNVVLSILDEQRLKSLGIDTSGMGWAVLVPIYLFRRAEILRQSPGYAWAWLACFVLTLVVG